VTVAIAACRPDRQRWALGLEYDGGAFNGFQRQSHAPSVQGALEDALSQIANEPVRVVCAGRTDAGVHATQQVVSFETAAQRSPRSWIRGTNTLTPPALAVRWARAVPAEFHARYSATARRYLYLFDERAVPSPQLDPWTLATAPLDEEAMHRAAQLLPGERDFSAFRAAACQSPTAWRCVHHIAVCRLATLVVLDISANAFLLHMVRNIASALQQVGLGQRPPGWIAELLEAGDRTRLGRTAPPQALYLVDVSYPAPALPPASLPGPLRAIAGLERFPGLG